MENVRWATPIFGKTSAKQVRDEIIEIANSNEYLNVKPQEVVNWARMNPGSALYGLLEWDDTKAANSWRKQQVRRIICNLVVEVVPTDDDKPILARTMLVTESEDRTAYKPIEYLMGDEYAKVLDAAYKEARAWSRKYKTLRDSGIQTIVCAIEEL